MKPPVTDFCKLHTPHQRKIVSWLEENAFPILKKMIAEKSEKGETHLMVDHMPWEEKILEDPYYGQEYYTGQPPFSCWTDDFKEALQNALANLGYIIYRDSSYAVNGHCNSYWVISW